jgi:DNA-binding response OmpR family regulator
VVDCPLLVVARVADEIDEIVALEHGADDYLARPLSPRKLRAHLLALLRRLAPPPPSTARETPLRSVRGWELDMVFSRLRCGANQVQLTAGQCSLLQCLMNSPGRVVARAELQAALNPRGASLQARSVDVYMHRLRRRLEEHGIAALRIEAVRGRGYVLHAHSPRRAGA